MNDLTLSPYCITPHVENLLSDTAQWTINGHAGKVLCRVSGLRDAIERAAVIGAPVTALRRDDVIVVSAQIAHFRKLIAGREVPPIKQSDYWSDA